MRIIGHHTCNLEGEIKAIAEAGPFYSEHDESDPEQFKFLGSGYYFWDNNIGMAHAYGKNIYRRRYYIFEAELELGGEVFLDLAGNRIDMLWFQDIMEKMKANNIAKDDWTIAHYLEFLKQRGQFPYRAIRAIDTNSNPKVTFKFVPNRPNFTNLNPVFIVCLLDTDKAMITTFKHFKTFPENVHKSTA